MTKKKKKVKREYKVAFEAYSPAERRYVAGTMSVKALSAEGARKSALKELHKRHPAEVSIIDSKGGSDD